MELVVLVVVLAVVLAAVVLVIRRREPDTLDSFRRQIDALSPEARRPVVDQVNRLDESGNATEPSDTRIPDPDLDIGTPDPGTDAGTPDPGTDAGTTDTDAGTADPGTPDPSTDIGTDERNRPDGS